jgi:glutamate-ammonia-ligase adenylyltransferase
VATRLQGFIDYQRDQAWTWEHMALTRARVISAPPDLAAKINAAIREVLTRPRDAAKTAADVADMRARIAREKGVDDPWELKHVRGGLLDIEFICQYLQLVHGAQYPDALDPNTCAALAKLGKAGAIDEKLIGELIAASRLYRGVMGLLRIAIEGRFDPAQSPAGLRDALARTSGVDSFDALERQLPATLGRIADLFTEIVGAPD